MAKILVVDDDRDLVEIVVQILKDEGHMVESALNGQEALKKAKEFWPEVVFLDIMMPGMDGYEVFCKLKEMGMESSIVVITAHREGEIAEKALCCLNEGAYTIAYKPFEPEELLSMVKEVS
jgi:DNA-binding response OmpR family regulator